MTSLKLFTGFINFPEVYAFGPKDFGGGRKPLRLACIAPNAAEPQPILRADRSVASWFESAAKGETWPYLVIREALRREFASLLTQQKSRPILRGRIVR